MSPGVYVAAVIATVIVGAGIGVVAFSTDEPVDGPAGGASAPASPIERQLAEGQRLEGEGKAAEALRAYDAVIRDDPENVQAHTYRGWLLARSTLVNEGLESLDKALALDPQYPVAHLFRGMVLHRYAQDPAGAIQEFETFLAANPPPNSVPAVRRMLDEARQALAQPPAPGPERPDQSGSQAPTGTGG